MFPSSTYAPDDGNNGTNGLISGTTAYVTGTPLVTSSSAHHDTNSTIGDSGTDIRHCYTCTGPCIFKSIELTFIIGVIANILIVICVAVDKNLHKPTFVAIAALALSDAVALVTNTYQSVVVVRHILTCSKPVRPPLIYIAWVGVTIFVANSHVALLATVRFIILTFPFKANFYLTNSRILVTSACIWVAGCLVYVPAYVHGEMTGVSTLQAPEFAYTSWVIMYLLPLVLTSVLHIIKLILLKNSTVIPNHGARRQSIVRMGRLIFVVICLSVMLPLPKFLFDSYYIINDGYDSTDRKSRFRDIAIISLYLNNNINPFIYAFMATPFRKSLRHIILNRSCSSRGRSLQSSRTSSMVATITSTNSSRSRVESFSSL